MKLIVGLGNPGKEYEKTRHNCGFMVLDCLSDKYNVDIDQKKFKGLYTKVNVEGQTVILLKPQTFMNNSGESVRAVMDFFKIDIADVIVIYDDLDMPTGKLRLREKGSAGGHNGIKSIIQHVGSQNFKRVRVGIDRHPRIAVVDYVLGRFSKDQQSFIESGIKNAAEAVHDCITHDFSHAMNQFN